MIMKNVNTEKFTFLLSKGFNLDNKTRQSIEENFRQKIAPSPYLLRRAFVFGAVVLLIGISIFLNHKSANTTYFGPNGLYNDMTVYDQSYGESGPRGLEVNSNYIHFQ